MSCFTYLIIHIFMIMYNICESKVLLCMALGILVTYNKGPL